jgi:hypothetical protein
MLMNVKLDQYIGLQKEITSVVTVFIATTIITREDIRMNAVPIVTSLCMLCVFANTTR